MNPHSAYSEKQAPIEKTSLDFPLDTPHPLLFSQYKLRLLKGALFCSFLVLTALSCHGFFSRWNLNSSTVPKLVLSNFDLYEDGIEKLQMGLEQRVFTSEDLVNAYIRRINQVNGNLRAVIEISSQAILDARASDQNRPPGRASNRLYGIPILIKDNIGTDRIKGLRTTSGSFALFGARVIRDSTVVERLRAKGAIILGTLNMSEFANARGKRLPPGWSARGNQTINPYHTNGNPCGSSSGSGVAAAVGLATVTLGTETDGSITCPAGYNNVVGIKPSIGTTSRIGVVPVSIHQDSIGPLTRTVRDGAIVLSAIAGNAQDGDPNSAGLPREIDYTQALRANALNGVRIGVPRDIITQARTPYHPDAIRAFNEALQTMRRLGAEVIDPVFFETFQETVRNNYRYEELVLNVDLKVQLNEYLNNLIFDPPFRPVRNLADVIQFIRDDPRESLTTVNQEKFIEAQRTNGRDADFDRALRFDKEVGGTRGINRTLQRYRLKALVLPSDGFTSTPPAIAGYPIVTVPLGFFGGTRNCNPPIGNVLHPHPAPEMPFGMAFFGAYRTEFDLISYAYAYEQGSRNPLTGRTTRESKRACPFGIPQAQL